MSEPPTWDIPDVSAELAQRVRVERWNEQAWPPLTFGVPEGWSDVPAEEFAWLAAERRIPPDAPILRESSILAAVRRRSDHGLSEVQLRRFDRQALAGYVLDDPVRWTQGRRQIGEPRGEPTSLRICGCAGVRLDYSCVLDGEDYVFAEAWWAHPSTAHYFVASAPAAAADAVQRDFGAMLENMQEQGGYPFATPAAPAATESAQGPAAPAQPVPVRSFAIRYRCPVQTQLPYVLQNVTSQQHRFLMFGSPSFVAWSMVGIAAMSMYGKAKAAGMEGRVVSVPAPGEIVLTDDSLALHVVARPSAGRVRLRSDPGTHTVDLEIPYRLVRQWGRDGQGIWLDIVGRGVVRLQAGAADELAGWLGHLSHGHTWQPPVAMSLQAPSAIGGWCQQDARLTFAYPQGWGIVDPGVLADYSRSFAPDRLICGVGLDAGQHEAQVLVIDGGLASAQQSRRDSEVLAALLIEAVNPHGEISLITLDGEPAVLGRAVNPTPEGNFDRTYVFVAHAGELYAFWYAVSGGQVGDGSHERWLPAFHAMLATWHWR